MLFVFFYSKFNEGDTVQFDTGWRNLNRPVLEKGIVEKVEDFVLTIKYGINGKTVRIDERRVSKKPKLIKLKEDISIGNKKYDKESMWLLVREDKTHYLMLTMDDIYIGFLKEDCEIIEVN